MRHGIISSKQKINGYPYIWGWHQKHYQAHKKGSGALFNFRADYTGQGINDNTLYIMEQQGAIMTPTPKYNLIGKKLTLEITNTIITLSPLGGFPANDNIMLFVSDLIGTYYLTDNIATTFITNWNTSVLHCVYMNQNNNIIDTGYTVTVQKTGNKWVLENANIPLNFHAIQWNIRMRESGVPAPLTPFTYSIIMILSI